MSFRMNNIQEVLMSTQLLQRLQNIAQDQTRLQQAVMPKDAAIQDEIKEETIEETEESENPEVRTDEHRRFPYRGRSKKPKKEEEEPEPQETKINPPNSGNILDITV